MAEEELTQTGIRVGGWLPAVPGEPGREPGPPAVVGGENDGVTMEAVAVS